MKTPKVLFFIHGPVPTADDRQQAAELEAQGNNVGFRNLQWVTPEAGIEIFDSLAGDVPPMYQEFLAKLESDDDFQADIERQKRKAPAPSAPPAAPAKVELVEEEATGEDMFKADAPPPVAKAKKVSVAISKKTKAASKE